MTTVTGLTADRMLAIEAASVVDGDVDASGNLILTKHDGTQINAGPVIGPPGPQGPVGSMLSVITAQPVLDVGVINQIRAGRQLSPGDFGNMGLSAPIAVWNLSDLSDSSGNGRALLNKGAVGFNTGINGAANTAAQFYGTTAQGLYISDTGVNDPFRIRVGTVGAWIKSDKPGTQQSAVSKLGAPPLYGWDLYINPTGNVAGFQVSTTGSDIFGALGLSNVCDDRWHFLVGTADGAQLRIYVDGLLEGTATVPNFIFPTSTPLNVGARGADGATASALAFTGRVDEAFVTSDVLNEDQIRNLYCAKIAHTNGTIPARFTLNVRRRRRGAALAVADFSTQPLRLHNFSAGSLGDEGSNGVALTPTNAPASVAGVDGSANNAYNFVSASNQILSSIDTGLPSGLAARSYGCWMKNTLPNAFQTLITWGTLGTGEARMDLSNINPTSIRSINNGDVITGPVVGDGHWHFVVTVEDNGALDGIKRKLYVDGRMVAYSSAMNPITLAGGSHFRIGSNVDGSQPFNGQIDAAFVCGYALTFEQIIALYTKSLLVLTPSPKNPGDHIEGADANNIFAIFDTLDSNAQVDLKVAS